MWHIVKLILVFIFLFSFLGIRHFPEEIFVPVVFLLSITHYARQCPFNKVIFGVLLCLVFNIISSYYFRNQSFTDTLFASKDIICLMLVWYFLSWKFSLEKWEKILFWLCFVFCLCYIVQYIVWPLQIFSGQLRAGDERRFTLIGQGLASFSVIFGLNKYFCKRETKYIALFIMGIFCVLGCGYRTILIGNFIACFCVAFRQGISLKILIKASLVLILCVFVLDQIDYVHKTFMDMAARNEALEGESMQDNGRFLLPGLFYTYHFKSPYEIFFGSGLCRLGIGEYGKYIGELQEYNRMYYADVGLLGYSWMVGIPMVLIFICNSLWILLKKLPKEYCYINFFFLEVLVTGLTTHEFYFYSSFVLHAILFCILTILLNQNKVNKRNNESNIFK